MRTYLFSVETAVAIEAATEDEAYARLNNGEGDTGERSVMFVGIEETEDVATFGIPYAEANDDGSETCPVCGERIVQSVRKDFESFSGVEYAKHYAALHTDPETEDA